MTLLPSLTLENFSLAENDDAKLAFSATGTPVLIDPATGETTPIAGGPPMSLGIGLGIGTPTEIRGAFGTDGLSFPDTRPGLWLQTPMSAAGPNWYCAIATGGVELYGIHALPADALAIPGFTFSNLSFRIALISEGTAIRSAVLAISGEVAIAGRFAHVDFDGVTMAADLRLEVSDGAALGQILDDPASVLDAAFDGRLAFRLNAGRLALGSHFAIESADLDFDCHVTSAKNVRTVTLGDTNFRLTADTLALAGTTFDDLDLSCSYRAEGQALSLGGATTITLPAQIGDIVTGAGTGLTGRVSMTHGPEGPHRKTALAVSIESLSLAPEINFLELTARDLALSFNYLDRADASDTWEVALEGFANQSWAGLAAGLESAGIVALPDADNLPEIAGHLKLGLRDTGSGTEGEIAYRMELIRPGTSENPVAYDNAFGPLPIRLGAAAFTVTAAFDVDGLGAWAVAGTGRVSTTGWLADLLPVDRMTVTASASGDGEAMPDLALTATGGLPPLTLPPFLPGSVPIDLITPDSLRIRLGERLEVEGHATIAGGTAIIDRLGLPSEWDGLLGQIATALPWLDASFTASAPVEGNDPARLSVTLTAIPASDGTSSLPEFRLLETLAAIATATADATGADGPEISSGDHEFFTARFEKITFDVTAGDDLTLALSMSFTCRLFGESFDVTALLGLQNGQPEFLLMGGLTDPVTLRIPGIDAKALLGDLDVASIVQGYNLDEHLASVDTTLFPGAVPSDADATIEALADTLMEIFDDPGNDAALVFEIRDFGLRFRLDEAPSVSGTVRLKQMPGFLDAVLPENGFDFGIGASARRLFISVKGPSTRSDDGVFQPHETQPLISVPLGQTDAGEDHFLNVFFGRFELEYNWASTGFGFVFDAAVVPVPDSIDDLAVMGNGIFFPGQSTFIRIQKPMNTGAYPIVIPQWAFSFDREEGGSVVNTDARDEMGLQVFGGIPETRFFTAYFREFTLSPTYFAMQPGIALDGGLIVGPHSPQDHETRQDMIDAMVEGDTPGVLIHADMTKAAAILLPSNIGAMLNPLTLIPPFLHPVAPFWIYPPYYMGDVYFENLSASITIPHVLHFGVSTSRPLPNMSLQAMMELAAMAMSGFAEPIPDESPLREVYYVTLDIHAELPLIDGLTGPVPALDLFFEVNVADLANGLIHIRNLAETGIGDLRQLSATLAEDPTTLVKMIPPEARRFTLDAHTLLGLSFSGSAALLTPDELRAELILFHENRRILPTGLGRSKPAPRIAAFQGAAPNSRQFSLSVPGHLPQPISRLWSFGDGQTSTATMPTHAFPGPGQYDVSVTWTDAAGASRTAAHVLTIEGPPVIKRLDLDGKKALIQTFPSRPRDRFLEDETPLGKYVKTISPRAVDTLKSAQNTLKAFIRTRDRKIAKWQNEIAPAKLERIWAELKKIPVGRADLRADIWKRERLGEIGQLFEDRIRKTMRNSPDIFTPEMLPGAKQRELRRAQAETVDAFFATLDISAGTLRSALARKLLDGVIEAHPVLSAPAFPARPAPGRPLRPGGPADPRLPLRPRTPLRTTTASAIALKPAAVRKDHMKSVLAGDADAATLAKLEDALTRAMDELPRSGTLDDRARKRWEAKLLDALAGAIDRPAAKKITDILDLPLMQLTRKSQVESALRDLLAHDPGTKTAETEILVLTGTLIVGWLDLGSADIAPPATGSVTEPTGWAIHRRGSDTVIVEVATPTPALRVEMRAGRQTLIVGEGADETATPLGPWTDDIPATPAKPERLRAMLEIRPTSFSRAPTGAETAWMETEDSVPESYQHALLARPEYVIAPEGGAHGPMSIGDLLRRADGSYILPSSPALLAGATLRIWGLAEAEVSVAGMLSAPGDVFLAGRASVTLTRHGYTLALDGTFRVIAGELWANALAGQDAVHADQLSFEGTISVSKGGEALFGGASSGTISTTTQGVLDLSVATAFHDAWTAELGDTEVLKVEIDSDLALRLTGTGSKFSLTSAAELDVTIWRAEPETIEVEVTPATRLCSWVPQLSATEPFVYECVNIAAVTMELPDLTNLVWADPQTFSAGAKLSFTMGASFSASVEVSAGGLVNGQFPVTLPTG